jgi:large subunit ribosomal protein L21
MRIAIVESGGKQYRAVEGSTIDVDRLASEVGKSFDFERVMLMVDDDVVMVGTPTVNDIKVSATVVDHIKGPKVISFKYRPKKRIRVKGGHRHFYTRLMIDFIGKPGEERKVEVKAVAPIEVAKEADDLTKIEGIGPKVAGVLNGAGIFTFEDLANAKVADVQEVLNAAKLQMMNPEGWIPQAELAAKGDWDGFEKLQAELKGGRKVS